jgi:hypothetical protein
MFFFTLIFLMATASSRTTESLAVHAIKAVIDEYFSKIVHEIEVISFGTRYGQAEEIIEKLLSFGQQSIPMQITREAKKLPQLNEFKLNKPSVLLFDSPENFSQTQQRIVFQHGNLVSHPHLVYIHNATIADIQVAGYKNHTIDKTIFLVNETLHSIELATAFLFTPDACHTNQFKVINRFTRQPKQWDNSNFFVEKYSKLHGCALEIHDGPFFARELNFTVKIRSDDISVNETISFLSDHYLNQIAGESNTYVNEINTRKIFIPPGELYGEYEKMLLPFDTTTWIAIVVMIVASILTVLAIKLKDPLIQAVIFGRNNRSPLMNFINIVLNGGQHTTLIENAPRILLLTLIFWSLIFR